MIKNIALILSIYTVAAVAIIYKFWGLEQAIGTFVGGLLMFVNVLSLSYLWKLIISKKSIALAIVVIIFKYLILGMILWGLASSVLLKVEGFLIGIVSLVFAILIANLQKSFFKSNL